MISEQRKQEIVAVFQRSFKRDNTEEIEAIPLPELRDAHAMLGNRDKDAGFRIRLQQRIAHLEQEQRKSDQARSSLASHIITFISGVASGLLVAAISFYVFQS